MEIDIPSRQFLCFLTLILGYMGRLNRRIQELELTHNKLESLIDFLCLLHNVVDCLWHKLYRTLLVMLSCLLPSQDRTHN